MDSLNTGILKGVPILLPPASEQRGLLEHIASRTCTIQRATSQAECETTLLREYRTRLIADVVTGKLDVREAAAQLPDEPAEPDSLDEVEDLIGADLDTAEELDAIPEEATV